MNDLSNFFISINLTTLNCFSHYQFQ